MLPGQKNQSADSNSRSESFREPDFDCRFWGRSISRSRSGPGKSELRRPAQDRRFQTQGRSAGQLLQAENVQDVSGLYDDWNQRRTVLHSQWARRHRRIALTISLLLLACASSCSRKDDPQAAYDHAFSVLRQGDLRRAEEEAHRECQRYRGSNPEWTWKFRTLEANAFLQQGRYEDTLKLLKSEPLPSGEPDLAIPVLWLQGEADLETHNFPEAESSLEKASAFCATSTSPRCGYVLK